MWVMAYTIRASHNNVSKSFPPDHQPNKWYKEPLFDLDEFAEKMLFYHKDCVCPHFSLTCPLTFLFDSFPNLLVCIGEYFAKYRLQSKSIRCDCKPLSL